jgi:general secretion pathway protein C
VNLPALATADHIHGVRRVFLVGLFLAGCGGGAATATQPHTAAAAKAPARSKVPKGAVSRAELLATVNAGLGRFLQRVDVEPSLDAGQFRGFRIVALHPPGYWQGVDLQPGDVVTALNGMPIETEMQAYDAFQSLKRADAVRVSYLRAGKTHTLVVPIVGAPPPAQDNSQKPNPAAKPASSAKAGSDHPG